MILFISLTFSIKTNYIVDWHLSDVGYIYQNTAKLREEEGTQEYSPPDLLDATLEGLFCLISLSSFCFLSLIWVILFKYLDSGFV